MLDVLSLLPVMRDSSENSISHSNVDNGVLFHQDLERLFVTLVADVGCMQAATSSIFAAVTHT